MITVSFRQTDIIENSDPSQDVFISIQDKVSTKLGQMLMRYMQTFKQGEFLIHLRPMEAIQRLPSGYLIAQELSVAHGEETPHD